MIEEQGWPAGAFVLGDSGNGAHLDVKIDLPNLPESVTLVKDCLEAWDFLFSDETIEVDTTSQNPARIWKIYGTMARKGDSTAERPHRLARLLEVPEVLETVSREKLKHWRPCCLCRKSSQRPMQWPGFRSRSLLQGS